MTKYKVSVYKIYWEDSDEIYIGITRQKIAYRVATHRSRSKKCNQYRNNCKVHLKMKDDINFKYVLLESAEVTSTDEKHKLEQKYIDDLKPKLNMIRAESLPYSSKALDKFEKWIKEQKDKKEQKRIQDKKNKKKARRLELKKIIKLPVEE